MEIRVWKGGYPKCLQLVILSRGFEVAIWGFEIAVEVAVLVLESRARGQGREI